MSWPVLSGLGRTRLNSSAGLTDSFTPLGQQRSIGPAQVSGTEATSFERGLSPAAFMADTWK